MDSISHFLFGLFTSIFFTRTLGPEFIMLGTMMAGAPDFDVFLAPFKRWSKNFYFVHRGGSHSVITAGVFALLVAYLFWFHTGLSFFLAWFTGFSFYCLHLFIDTLTTSMTPLFYPISKKEYKLNMERAVNPGFMLISFVVVLSMGPIGRLTRSIVSDQRQFFTNYITVLGLVYYGYLLFRITLKVGISRKLSPEDRFLPGISLFRYFIYSKSDTGKEICFRFMKKKLISRAKTEKIEKKVEFRVVKGSEEFELFSIAQKIGSQYRFFRKWRLEIPLFHRIEGRIIVTIILAEAFTFSRGYMLQVMVDAENREILHVTNGFGKIGEGMPIIYREMVD